MHRWAWLCAVVLLLTGCGKETEREREAEQRAPVETSVSFDLESVPSKDGAQIWIATHKSAAGKVARFKMDFGAPEKVPGKATESGEGTLLPEAGSDSSDLLPSLARVLHAQAEPIVPPTKTSVPFTYQKLGNPGEMKLIFGDGDKQSELLLRLDAAAKKGQFTMSDGRYGNRVLAELQKVL